MEDIEPPCESSRKLDIRRMSSISAAVILVGTALDPLLVVEGVAAGVRAALGVAADAATKGETIVVYKAL